MFKVEGNLENEMLLNNNINEVCKQILSEWMSWVADGGYTLGLYDFMKEQVEDMDITIQDKGDLLYGATFNFENLHKVVCGVSNNK